MNNEKCKEASDASPSCCDCPNVNRKLIVSKLFYYCFWSAYGSFFPLLGVYYKQIGMNPTQSGLLVGCRPFVEFLSAPSLSSMADKMNIRKIMIVVNIICWIAFVFPIGMIKPSDKTCHRYIMLSKNITEFTSQESEEVNDFLKSNTPQEPQIHPHHKGVVVFSEDSIHKVFWVLLFLSVIGEFLACPAPSLADTATLNALGPDKDKYGRQRMFGSLGWGSAMFLVGFAIDALPEYEVCDVKISKDYSYAFYFFLCYMVCALVICTRFNFTDSDACDDTISGSPRDVLHVFMQVNYFSTVFAAFYAGLGMGLTRVFLFWHLEDLGAPPSLFGISSATDHLAETMTYFMIEVILSKVTHVQVIYMGLLVNFVRFILISYLVNPWFILPLDLLQGFSHAGVWAALTSYLSKAAPKGYKAAVQGILQGFYYGLGRAVGAIGGGVVAHYYGTNFTFRMYGYCSIPVFVFMFLMVTFHSKRQKNTISDKIDCKLEGDNTLDTTAAAVEVDSRDEKSITIKDPDQRTPNLLNEGNIVGEIFINCEKASIVTEKCDDDLEPCSTITESTKLPEENVSDVVGYTLTTGYDAIKKSE